MSATTESPPRRMNPHTGKPETAQQRRERLMADTSPVRVKGVARIVGLTPIRVRDLLGFRRSATAVLADEHASDAAKAAATRYLQTAIPQPQPDPDGERGIWWRACDIYAWGRLERLDEWYEPRPGGAERPGRPAGGAPAFRARRPSFGEQLRRLANVHVSNEHAAALTTPLLDAYAAAKAAGMSPAQARDAAVAAVGEAPLACPSDVARKVLLRIITAQARPGLPALADVADTVVTGEQRQRITAALRAKPQLREPAQAAREVAEAIGCDPRQVWRVLLEDLHTAELLAAYEPLT